MSLDGSVPIVRTKNGVPASPLDVHGEVIRDFVVGSDPSIPEPEECKPWAFHWTTRKIQYFRFLTQVASSVSTQSTAMVRLQWTPPYGNGEPVAVYAVERKFEYRVHPPGKMKSSPDLDVRILSLDDSNLFTEPDVRFCTEWLPLNTPTNSFTDKICIPQDLDVKPLRASYESNLKASKATKKRALNNYQTANDDSHPSNNVKLQYWSVVVWYRLRAKNSQGWSQYSNQVVAVPLGEVFISSVQSVDQLPLVSGFLDHLSSVPLKHAHVDVHHTDESSVNSTSNSDNSLTSGQKAKVKNFMFPPLAASSSTATSKKTMTDESSVGFTTHLASVSSIASLVSGEKPVGHRRASLEKIIAKELSTMNDKPHARSHHDKHRATSSTKGSLDVEKAHRNIQMKRITELQDMLQSIELNRHAISSSTSSLLMSSSLQLAPLTRGNMDGFDTAKSTHRSASKSSRGASSHTAIARPHILNIEPTKVEKYLREFIATNPNSKTGYVSTGWNHPTDVAEGETGDEQDNSKGHGNGEDCDHGGGRRQSHTNVEGPPEYRWGLQPAEVIEYMDAVNLESMDTVFFDLSCGGDQAASSGSADVEHLSPLNVDFDASLRFPTRIKYKKTAETTTLSSQVPPASRPMSVPGQLSGAQSPLHQTPNEALELSQQSHPASAVGLDNLDDWLGKLEGLCPLGLEH